MMKVRDIDLVEESWGDDSPLSTLDLVEGSSFSLAGIGRFLALRPFSGMSGIGIGVPRVKSVGGVVWIDRNGFSYLIVFDAPYYNYFDLGSIQSFEYAERPISPERIERKCPLKVRDIINGWLGWDLRWHGEDGLRNGDTWQ